MRGLTYQMVYEYQKYVSQVHEWQIIREKAFLDYIVENLIPQETESKALNAIVIKLLEFYTYTDIKESITILNYNGRT